MKALMGKGKGIVKNDMLSQLQKTLNKRRNRDSLQAKYADINFK
jgi:hypothetical protein